MSMPEVESALVVIRRAIHNEVAGQRFYNDASFFCIDPWAKDIFSNLAREEEKHTRLLLVEYEALETRGRWVDPDTALVSESGVDITKLTFSDDDPVEELFPSQRPVGDVVDRRADDLAALAFGIRLEQEAIELYESERVGVQDPAAQKAYEFLVEEEMRHHHQLKKQWERLAGRPFSDI